MFTRIEYLKSGNEKQRNAYKAINELGIMEDLHEYQPVLCGTIPIGIDVKGSDLDIIMEVTDFERFEKTAASLYSGLENFNIKKRTIRNVPVIKANFLFQGFEFELFGQPVPVHKQYAYLHMVIEHALLEQYPHIKDEIIRFKQEGYKTEPAFCKVFGLEGDPYERLIEFGKEKGIVELS
jgi:hypothetical protein